MRYSKRRKDLTQQDNEQSAKTLFKDALKAFLDGQDAAGHSKVSHTDYRRVIGLFLRYMSETYHYSYIQEISERDILAWFAHLRNTLSSRGRPYSSRSIQTYSVDVLAFFRWLAKHDYVDLDITEKIITPKVDKLLIRVFTDDELAMLDEACDRQPKGKSLTPDERKALAARDKAILWMLLSTGMRVSELCGLRFCDIDWKSSMIYVFGKGSKERKVPFGKVARQHLNTYLQHWRGQPDDPVNDSLFLNVFGNPVTRAGIQGIFQRLACRAGIKDKRVSAHTCRHWFAVNAIKRGMPTIVLKEILGHETWDMINTYVRLSEQDNYDIYSRFSPVDSLPMHHSAKGKREEVREWRNARKKKV
ncbi:MAG TPA: tyrosine-type recombinase/integrase [Ktedonobacteraceae bacterium]